MVIILDSKLPAYRKNDGKSGLNKTNIMVNRLYDVYIYQDVNTK